MRFSEFMMPGSIFSATAAQYDFLYSTRSSTGRPYENTVTLTPSTYLSISSNGTFQTQNATVFKSGLSFSHSDISDFTSAVAAVAPPGSWSTLTGKPSFGNTTLVLKGDVAG